MVVINIRGVLVKLILDIYPEFYGPFVATDKKGEKVIIVQCMNSIYVTMVASLLYYRKILKTLKNTGLKFNPYDPLVANRPVNNKRQTIFFHVEDCKLRHQYSKVNGKFINTLRDEYSSVFEDRSEKMKVSRGKVHEYLGMNLDYSVKGQVNTTMIY